MKLPKMITVLRGNRTYMLISVNKKSAADNPLIDSVFNSFQLLDFSRNNWNKFMAPDSTFEAWLPGPFILTDTDTEDFADITSEEKVTVNEFLSHDNSTSASYNIQREHFNEYYFISDDSTFFNEQATQFLDKGDSIVAFKLLTIGKDKASDVVIKNEGSSITKKIRFLLHGDTLYKVFTYSPKWLNDENLEKFFTQFSFTSTALATTLYTDKTAQLVSDLQSADSATFDRHQVIYTMRS